MCDDVVAVYRASVLSTIFSDANWYFCGEWISLWCAYRHSTFTGNRLAPIFGSSIQNIRNWIHKPKTIRIRLYYLLAVPRTQLAHTSTLLCEQRKEKKKERTKWTRVIHVTMLNAIYRARSNFCRIVNINSNRFTNINSNDMCIILLKFYWKTSKWKPVFSC